MRRGFTLIELLVVIAIIAVLAGLLFPVFARAREKGRQAMCTSNQKQIAMAAQMDAQEHEDHYAVPASFWGDLNLPAGVLRCPSRDPANGYQYNSDLGGMSTAKVTEPSSIFLTVDGNSDTSSAGSVPNVYYNTGQLDPKHNGSVIAAFADGHGALTNPADTLFYGGPVPALCNSGFEYPAETADPLYEAPPATTARQHWAFTGTAGIARGGSSQGNPAAPEGQQVAFLHKDGVVKQCVIMRAGSYKLTFKACCGSASAKLTILLDEHPFGSAITLTNAFAPYSSDTFTLENGTHTLGFQGIDIDGTDRIAYLDDVAVALP